MNPSIRFLDLDGTVNTRDLGGWRRADGSTTAYGRVIRSDMPRTMSAQDRERLHDAGIRTIFDLRSAQERNVERHPLASDEAFDVVSYDLMAPVIEARSSGRGHVDDPFDLGALYLDMTVASRDVLREMFVHMRDAKQSGGVMVHCTAGKDRTGVVAALALRASGVADPHIIADYEVTATRLAPLYPHLLTGVTASGVPEEHAHRLLTAEASTMAYFLAHVDEAWTSVAEGLLDD